MTAVSNSNTAAETGSKKDGDKKLKTLPDFLVFPV